MDELFLYQLFESILKNSKVIQGRFVVVEGSGNDLNSNNFDDVIKDALGGVTMKQKYPAAILLPPVDVDEDGDDNWSRYRLKLYFLTPAYCDGTGQIKEINKNTNTSNKPIKKDWKEMRTCAGDFLTVLNLLMKRTPGLLSKIKIVQRQSPYTYERHSSMANDRLCGVSVTFEVDLLQPCEVTDYDASLIDQIKIPV